MKIRNRFTRATLLDYPGDTLQGAALAGAYLAGAVLRGADLTGADLRGAALHGAVLRGADLTGATLHGAVLRGADLSGADLRWAVLRGAVLRGADLMGAVLTYAILPNGKTLPEYIAWLPEGLLTQGGKPLADVIAAWGAHTWQGCPMSAAFDAKGLADVPKCWRAEAATFVALFDGGHLPRPR